MGSGSARDTDAGSISSTITRAVTDAVAGSTGPIADGCTRRLPSAEPRGRRSGNDRKRDDRARGPCT